MLVLAYFTEGTIRGHTDTGTSAYLTLQETALAIVFFITVIAYVLQFARDHVKYVCNQILTIDIMQVLCFIKIISW